MKLLLIAIAVCSFAIAHAVPGRWGSDDDHFDDDHRGGCASKFGSSRESQRSNGRGNGGRFKSHDDDFDGHRDFRNGNNGNGGSRSNNQRRQQKFQSSNNRGDDSFDYSDESSSVGGSSLRGAWANFKRH